MSKTFCNFPWEHVYIETNSKHRICCMGEDFVTQDDGYFHTNVSNSGIDGHWNNEYMKEIRVQMLNGERPAACKKCFSIEDQNLPSMRDSSRQELHMLNTLSNGTLKSDPTRIELHFGNFCNLRCKMCSQYFSHSIGKELLSIEQLDPDFIRWVKKESANVNNWTHDFGKIDLWFQDKKIKNNVFEKISSSIKKINFIGGEPTIIPEFYELLEFCKEKNTLADKEIQLITNCTNINKKVMNYLTEAKSLQIHCSIDALDERNHYIRYPADWKTILSNLNFYKELCSNNRHNFYVSPAWQILNIDQMIEFDNFFYELGIRVASMPRVVSPRICDYVNFPFSYRQKVAAKLQSQINSMKDKTKVQIVQNYILDLLKTEYITEKNLMHAFITYNDKQDSYRKVKTWRSLLPGLEKSLIEHI